MVYKGYCDLVMEDSQMSDFYSGKYSPNLLINQYMIIRNSNNEIVDKGRWGLNGFVKLSYPKMKDFKPLSVKQEFLFDLVNNPDIPIRIIAGVAGSGKTRVAAKFGIYHLTKGDFSQLFVVRHNVSVGEKNGYLPGDKVQKTLGWLGFLEDNLEDVQYTLLEMIDRKMLEVDGVEFMKGRDLKNKYILIDEAEDLLEEQFKMLGERVSAGSVINFVGDYDQTTQDKYKKNSGLKRAIKNLAGNPKVGIIVLDDKDGDNVRSEVSKIFTSLY